MPSAAPTHSCDAVRERFSELLDGTLPTDEAARLRATVADCPECSDELERLRATLGRLGGLRTGAPPAFVASVQARIHARSRGRFFAPAPRGWRRWLTGRWPFEWLSFAMIVAMLVYYILVLRSAPTEIAPAP